MFGFPVSMPRIVVLGLCLTPLLACSDNRQISPGFGNAVRHNIAVQTVNPDRHQTDMGAPEHDGARASAAIGRYRAGKVTPLAPQGTSDLSPSGKGK